MTRTIRRLFPAILLLLVPLIARAATEPSWFLPIHEAGTEWPDGVYTVGIAFGDVDGDGRDEVAIATNATSGARLWVLDDAAAGFAPLWTFGEGWGAGAYATSVTMGNIDGDARAEIGLTRATSVNERAYVFDDAAAGFATLEQWGAGWAPTVHAIDIALSNSPAAVAVAHNGNSGPRVFVYGGVAADFAPLWNAGGDWGSAAIATAVAFGDVDGDGAREVGITRQHNSNARVFVHSAAGDLLWTTGETWGAGAWAIDIAFGNVDNDPADEIGVARRSGVNERAIVFDDAAAAAPFASLARFGESWNPNSYATAIAFGDIDNDGRDEVGLAREVTINPRFIVFDDAIGAPAAATPPFGEIWAGGEGWPGPEYATAIAFGQVNGTAAAELGVGRRAGDGPRAFVFARGWSSRLPFVAGYVVEEE